MTSNCVADLNDIFALTLTVWAPLLEPVGPSSLPPWNSADNDVAQNVVVHRFVERLTWLPNSTYLPSETVEALFWKYFAKQLVNLQRAGTAHVLAVHVSV